MVCEIFEKDVLVLFSERKPIAESVKAKKMVAHWSKIKVYDGPFAKDKKCTKTIDLLQFTNRNSKLLQLYLKLLNCGQHCLYSPSI